MRYTNRWGLASKALIAFTCAATVATGVPTSALACTTFWIPSQYTANGSRYVARNEDGGGRYLKAYGIEESHEGTTYESFESDFSWTSNKTSYRYSYIRDVEDEWGDTHGYSAAGINEVGVSASATLSTDMNDDIYAIDPVGEDRVDYYDNHGIGEYNYVSIILGESATARQGVELVGSLVEQYGAMTNDQLLISDPTESWVVMVLSGHQWLAMKLPSDQVSFNPNMSCLRFNVDLDDENVCLHSADVVKMPQEAGLLKTFDDGTPDIAGTYGQENDGAAQNTRYAQGRAAFDAPLAEGTYTMGTGPDNWTGVASLDEDPVLFFTPGRSDYTTNDLFNIMRTQGEGTEFDAIKYGYYSIGNYYQMEGHAFEIRSGLSSDIATIQWEMLGHTGFSVAMPLYSALITETSPLFGTPSTPEEHGVGYGYMDKANYETALNEEEPADNLDYVFIDINTLCYVKRDLVGEPTRAYLDALQAEINEQQELVDAVMQATPADERTEKANILQDAITDETYSKCKTLLDELRTYLKDPQGEFCPSDFDPATGTMKQDLYYAAAIIGPEFTQQPASAKVEKGTQVTLTAEAIADEGTGYVTYAWFTKDAGTGALAPVTARPAAGTARSGAPAEGPTLEVDASTVGSTTYVCVATGARGLTTESEPATVEVTAPAATTDEPATTDPAADTKPATTDSAAATSSATVKPAGTTPKTGDATNAVLPIAVAGLGVILLGGAAIVRFRRKQD